jgi:hypothetical protein
LIKRISSFSPLPFSPFFSSYSSSLNSDDFPISFISSVCFSNYEKEVIPFLIVCLSNGLVLSFSLESYYNIPFSILFSKNNIPYFSSIFTSKSFKVLKCSEVIDLQSVFFYFSF